MQKDFLSEFLKNQVRARILRFLCMAPEGEYAADTIRKRAQLKNATAVERELVALARLGVIKKGADKKSASKHGAVRTWVLEREHPHAQALRAFVRDTQQPMDEGIIAELRHAGTLRLVIASGTFVDSEEGQGRIDLIIVGEGMKDEKVQATLRNVEADRGREILYAVFSPKEYKYRVDIKDRLIRDVLDYPHHILFDKLNVM